EGRELARGHLELDVLEDAMGAEGERDAFCGQDGVGDGGLHLRSIPILGPSVIRLILIMRGWLIPVLALTAVTAVVATAVRIEPAGASRSRVGVAAAVYPVAFAAQRVGGAHVGVTNLTPVGAEPHDLELDSDQLDQLLNAKVAFVLGSDFQPAVEKAAGRRDGPTVELLPKLVDARGK